MKAGRFVIQHFVYRDIIYLIFKRKRKYFFSEKYNNRILVEQHFYINAVNISAMFNLLFIICYRKL